MTGRTAKTPSNRGLEPYAAGMIPGRPNILRRPLEGRFVGVLQSKRLRRGLALIQPKTRCVRRYDIHELIVTDEMDAAPGGRVDRIFGLGFVEFAAGGVIAAGDLVEVGGNVVAEIAGFDETHAPNHLNIVAKTPEPRTGIGLGLEPGDSVTLRPHWRKED
jgi:hypothetical protein